MARKPKAELRILTGPERTFASHYALEGNVAAACREAGITDPTGKRWLKDGNIQAHIQTLQREAQAEYSLTRGKVIHGLLKETTGPSHAGRIAAWLGLAKIAGLMVERHDVRGTLDVKHQVVIYLPDNGRGDRAHGPTITVPSGSPS